MAWRRRRAQPVQASDDALPNLEIDEDMIVENVRILFDEQLGFGGYGVVYEGDWRGTPVAVKRVHSALVDDEVCVEQRNAFLQNFSREWRLFGHLRHPFIVQFLGVFEPQSRSPSLVMELMDTTLRKRCQRAPYLSDDTTVRLCGEVLCALVYLHGRNIVHRDLTTNNVLLTRGEDPTAKISDLGVARALFGDDPRRRVLSSQSRGMTRGPGAILYMSPESMDDSGRPYDTKHDVFSFGVLALSTCTRHEPTCFNQPQRVPLGDGSGNTRILPEAERRAVDLRDLPPTHPLRTIILECLRDSPSDRPTAEEIVSELERLPVTPTTSGVSTGGEEDVRAELARVRQALMAAELRTHDLADCEHTAQENVRQLQQQLTTTEQKLTTTEQQLTATEQRLTEANQRAQAAEQRVTTAEQRATTAEQEYAKSRRLLDELLTQREQQVTPTIPTTISQRPAVAAAAAPVIARAFSSYKWNRLQDIPGDGKYSHQAVHYREWIVLVGGLNKYKKLCNRVYGYNCITQCWCEWPQTPRSSCSSASDGRRLYALGGYNLDPSSSRPVWSHSVYYLSDDKTQWLSMCNIPHLGSSTNGVAFHQRKLFMDCGGKAHPGRLQVYDFTQQSWSVLSGHYSIAMERDKHSLVPWGNYLVASDMTYYDVESDQWHVLSAARRRSAKQAYSLAVINGQLIAVSVDCDNYGDLGSVAALESLHSDWSSLQKLPSARYFASSCTANNALYVTGGMQAENRFFRFS